MMVSPQYIGARLPKPALPKGFCSVPSSGGPTRQLLPDFLVAGFPIWSPDSRHVLLVGRKEVNSPTGWICVPIDGGTQVSIQMDLLIEPRRLIAGSPQLWLADGNRILFSGR